MSRKRTTLPTILNSKSNVSDWYRVLFPWKRLTAKSKSGHCSQEQNAAPNTVTHNSKYTNYTLYFVFTEIKKIIRGHSLGCILGWAVPMVIFFPRPFPLFFSWAPNFIPEIYKSIDFVVSDLFSHKNKNIQPNLLFRSCFEGFLCVVFSELPYSQF